MAHTGRAGAGGPADCVEGERARTYRRSGPSQKSGSARPLSLWSTDEGSLLWDPVGYVDDRAVKAALERGPVLAIAASHPHMFGVQVEWSHRLGGVPVLVADADRRWLGRKDPVIEYWSGSQTIAEGLTLHQTGGHFPGSAVVHWAAGAGGRGVLLTGDSVYPNPDRRSIAFMRSYPNHLAAVRRGGVASRRAAGRAQVRPDLRQLQQCHRLRSQGHSARFRPTARCLGARRLRPFDVTGMVQETRPHARGSGRYEEPV